MSDILNFNAPLGNQQLNFGADDFDSYTKYEAYFEVDYKNFPILYIEFDWKYTINANILRFFTLRVTDTQGAFIAKASTPFLKYIEDTKVSLVLDLTKFKDKDLIIEYTIFIEEVVENSDYLGMNNLKIFIGR